MCAGMCADIFTYACIGMCVDMRMRHLQNVLPAYVTCICNAVNMCIDLSMSMTIDVRIWDGI